MTPAQEAFAEAERRIAGWQEGEELDLAITELEEIPESIGALSNLTELNFGPDYEKGILTSARQLRDLGPLATLKSLQSLNCRSTQVSDLASLATLKSLQSLDCSRTQVSDLSPLATLKNLQSLSCSGTQVSNLGPLATLKSLQSLNCTGTQVSNLGPLATLKNLQSLSCYNTQVDDLGPLATLKSLQSLNCSYTQVSDLAPLQNLKNLQSLTCAYTQVSDLAPLATLKSLQSLDCSSTQVGDLGPLKNSTNLRKLTCTRTKVIDLAPLEKLDCLTEVDFSTCELDPVSLEVWQKPTLETIRLYGTRLPGVPDEVLSQEPYESCLDSLRAHLDDLGSDPVPMDSGKLLVLGNGRVGKTQICRKLGGKEFDPEIPSTHGIIVSSLPAPTTTSSAEPGTLHVWDFGGQDIYHGTHALFMKSRAIFLVAWTPEMEDCPTHEHGGMTFRNYPLPYWLEYVRRFGGEDSPVIVVQAQCDEAELEKALPKDATEVWEAFRFHKYVPYSAATDKGRPALNDALAQAYERLDKPLIGPGRLEVKKDLEALRDEDADLMPKRRRNRTMAYDEFVRRCEKAGNISDPDLFLQFLHNAGTVFYREGLFGNQLILDQGWALEAIYAVFHRENCYTFLERMGGRFTRPDLGRLLWDDLGHSLREQELFVSMMMSCGICFEFERGDDEKGIDATYIAPDLLPEETPRDVFTQLWEEDRETEETKFKYELLPPALLRAVMGRVGQIAGPDGKYWRSGTYVYESETASRALIEQTMESDWTGYLVLRAQKGRANALLERLAEIVREEERTLGLTSTVESAQSAPASDRVEDREQPALQFGREGESETEVYVSYAWADDKTAGGREREDRVLEFCASAEEAGIPIKRDRDELGYGDSISEFMTRLAAGSRIFIFLSDKYLKSPFCMYELTQIWRNVGHDEDEFTRRVRVYTLDDADIWSIGSRLKCAAHWGKEFEELDAQVKEFGARYLSARDSIAYRNMSRFAIDAGDILASIADRVQPRAVSEFEEHGFGDLLD